MARMSDFDGHYHKHKYRLISVQRNKYRPSYLQFLCVKCGVNCYTYLRALWYPHKMVVVNEQNVERIAKHTDITAEQLLERVQYQKALGATSLWINLERQLDGSWTNKPLGNDGGLSWTTSSASS